MMFEADRRYICVATPVLYIGASLHQGGGKLDQTLLLRSLADKLRGSNGFGAFRE